MNKVSIVGIGPGEQSLVTLQALAAINQCDVLIGGTRNLKAYHYLKKEELELKDNLLQVLQTMKELRKTKKITVLASGDPLLYGVASFLIKQLGHKAVDIVPGVSAIQYLAAKCGISWEGMHFASLHGRSQNIAMLLKKYKTVGLFLGKEVDAVLSFLVKEGLGEAYVFVGESLSYAEERIREGTCAQLVGQAFSPLSVMILVYKRQEASFSCCSIADKCFVQGQTPMTKEEVRAVSIAKLKLKEDCTVFDIGAGTGSITVEAGLRVPFGRIISFEKEEGALQLLRQNIEKFHIYHCEIVEGDVKDTFLSRSLVCDRAFIGGSGGRLPFIIKSLADSNEAIRIVLNTITLESLTQAMQALEAAGFLEIEYVCLTVAKSKKVGEHHMMMGGNPVYIISAQKGGCL